MNKKEKYNLINLFKLFKNRPNHLVKFLLDNDAFNEKFLNNVLKNKKLSDVNVDSDIEIVFNSIDDMKEHFSLYVNIEINNKKKTKEEILEELSLKIKEEVDNENYEEAARIRDYIIRNNLRKK
jgi:protein-arginine kinase activator protein McsA